MDGRGEVLRPTPLLLLFEDLVAPDLIHAARASAALIEPHMIKRGQLFFADETILAEELVLFAQRHEEIVLGQVVCHAAVG